MSTSQSSRMPELQAAVRALAGVASASIRWPEPEGPATLHIEFADAAERQSVTESVLDAVERVGGADLSSMRMALPPPPVGPPPDDGNRPTGAAGVRHRFRDPQRGRPVFHGLTVRRTAFDVTVRVTLGLGEGRLVGEAEGLATRQDTPRVAAAATLAALRELVPADTRLQLEWLAVHEAGHPARPGVVQAAVALLSAAGEELVIGSALLRDDARETAVRATLDALNRRLARVVAPEGPSRPPQG